MSEDKFFNTVKNKLDSIRPPVEAGAWKKLQSSLPIPWYASLFKEFGSWIIGGTATVALVGSGIINFQTKQENEKLFGEISTLKSEIQILQSKTDTVYLEKTVVDTVYIDRTVKIPVYKNVSNQEYPKIEDQKTPSSNIKAETNEQSIENESVNSEIISNSTNAKPLKTAKRLDQSDSESVKKNTSSKKSDTKAKDLIFDKNKTSQKQTSENTSQKSIVKEYKQADSNVKESISNNSISNESNLEKSNSIGTEQKATNKGNNAAENSIAKNEVIEDNSNQNGIPDLDKEKTKIEIEKPKLENDEMVIPDNPNKIVPELKKKSFKIPYIHSRAGMTGDLIGFDQIAVGPVGEFFIGNRFSFNLGVIFSGDDKIIHPYPKDFNFKTGKKFEDEIRPYLPVNNNKPERITDIKVSTSFIKMPLYFSYYIPVNRNLNFMITGGTKLDIKVFKEFDFKSGILGEVERNKLETSPKVNSFNNLNYGMGLEYKYKKLVFQLSPYFDFQFRKVDYLSFPRKFGVNSSIKFDFGR